MLAADISFWSVVWYALAGLVIGLLARAIMPGRQHMGLIPTILLGVIAAVLGGIAWNAIFEDQDNIAWIGSIIMAIILLWLYAKIAPRLSKPGASSTGPSNPGA